MQGLVSAIAHVNTGWSLAAFGIAALVILWRYLFQRRTAAVPDSAIWAAALVIIVLGLAPIIARAYTEHEKLVVPLREVYRIRTLVLDPQGIPISGASLRSTASNQTTTDSQGIGKVTIYADLNDQFLHGVGEIVLDKELNPSLTTHLKSSGEAVIEGLVEDQDRRAVPDAVVSVLGGETGKTGPSGTFKVTTNAAVGQPVRLHVEKPGCGPVDQEHPAGRGQATITLACKRKRQATNSMNGGGPLRVSSSERVSTDPSAPVEIQLVIATSRNLPDLNSIVVHCSGSLAAWSWTSPDRNTIKYPANGNSFVFPFSSLRYGLTPQFDPAHPLVFLLWSQEPVACAKVETF